VQPEALIVGAMAAAVFVAAGARWVQDGGDVNLFGFAALAALCISLFFGRWWPAVLALLAVALAVAVMVYPREAVAPAAQVAQEAAQGAAQRIRTVVQQYAPPAAPEAAEPPAIRGPKPGVEWDGKSIKDGMETAPREKAQPAADVPKAGKELLTPAPLVAQPVKPGKAQPAQEKAPRGGKATQP
jgi:hypothetical protein